MFNQASSFNTDISTWITSQVTTMDSMFYSATSFNQSDVCKWDHGKVTTSTDMFISSGMAKCSWCQGR
jgi:surface protein